MICGKNDWDELLEEARQRRIATGQTRPEDLAVPIVVYPTLADYGRSVSFSSSEIS